MSRQQAAAEPGAGLQETGGQPADAVARETSHHDNNMSVVLRRESFFFNVNPPPNKRGIIQI